METSPQYADIEKIVVKESLNPRKRRDTIADEQLYKSIAERKKILGDEKAIVEPLIITMRDGKDELTMLLANGARRLDAAKRAGIKQVPVIERDLTNGEIFHMRLLDDLQKGILHPLDESDAYNQLNTYSDGGALMTAEIAIKFGKEESQVLRRLKLQELSPEVRKAFEDGTIGVDHAEVLAIYPHKIQTQALNDVLLQKYLTGYDRKEKIAVVAVVRLKEWLRENALLDLNSVPFDKKDATLNPKIGACTECPHRTESLATLFGDLPGSMCTLAECFNAKRKAFAKREFEKSQTKYKVTPILVATEYGKIPKGVEPAWRWERCEEKDKGALLMQMVDGKQEGKVVWGRLKTIETKSEGKAAQQSKEERAKEERKALLEQKCHFVLLLTVIAKTPKKLTDKADMLVIHQHLCKCFSVDYEAITATLGLKGDSRKWTVPQLTQCIAAMFIAEIGQNDLGYLETVAKRYKVDAKKVRAAVKAEMEKAETKEQ